MRTFNKVIRSGARYEDGTLPPEVWREEAVAPTLNTFDIGQSRAVTLALSDDGDVRILSAEEYEVLQGFPAGWTAGQADGTRKKQLGNAVTVPIIEWIGRRL